MIAAWMLSLLTIGALLAIVGVSAESLAARVRAPRRLVWISAMVAMCVLPVVLRYRPMPLPLLAWTTALLSDARSWPMPLVASPLLDEGVPAPSAAATRRDLSLAPSVALRSAKAGIVVRESMARRTDAPLRALLVASSLGAMLLVIIATLRIRRERRRWTIADADTTSAVSRAAGRPVRVWLSDDIGPAAFGVRHPQVVLPPWVATLDDDARSLLFAHEASHIARHDPLLLRLALALVVLMPWNLPLLFAYRRLHRAVEHDCDSRVLGGTRDARTYARLLLATAERIADLGAAPSWSRVSRWLPAPVAGIGTRRSELETRLRALVRPASSWRTRVRALGAGMVLVAGVLAACSVPTPERTLPAVATQAGATGSALRIPARDDRSGTAGASTVDSLAAMEEFVAKVMPRAHLLQDSIIVRAARRAEPHVFTDTSEEAYVWLLLDAEYRVMRSNTGRQHHSLRTRTSGTTERESVAATPTTPRQQLSLGVRSFVRAFPGITPRNVSGLWSSTTVKVGAREVEVNWARYIPTPSVTAAPGDSITLSDMLGFGARYQTFSAAQRAKVESRLGEMLESSVQRHWQEAVVTTREQYPVIWILYDEAGRELGTAFGRERVDGAGSVMRRSYAQVQPSAKESPGDETRCRIERMFPNATVAWEGRACGEYFGRIPGTDRQVRLTFGVLAARPGS